MSPILIAICLTVQIGAWGGFLITWGMVAAGGVAPAEDN